MKPYIIKRLIFTVIASVFVLLLVSSLLQINSAEENYINSSNIQIDQVIDILSSNEGEISELGKDLEEDYLIRAEAASYILDSNPSALYDLEDLKNMASLLQIDEIHIFNSEGEIISGTVPAYYGFTFDSGEQMQFFKPLLDDKDLKLVQDVTPNTAEGKEMQYLAIWNESGDRIIQIGMEPIRLLDALEETELVNIFSKFATIPGSTILAIDSKDHTILGSSNEELNGKDISSLGLDYNADEIVANQLYKTEIDGEEGVGLYVEYQDLLIGVITSSEVVYESSQDNILVVIISGIIIGMLIIILIYFMLDRIILKEISKLIDGMKIISSGNFEYKMDGSGLTEFEELSKNINLMVKSVRESSRKFSTIFQYVNLPIAIYESREGKISVTSKMCEILSIDGCNENGDIENPKAFLDNIKNVMSNPYEGENDVYILNKDTKIRYLKIKLYNEDTSDWGIILDVTDEIVELNTVIYERDYDYLTEIYNRRAFITEVSSIFENPDELKHAVLLMMDLDNLKYVNDAWGHAFGDEYIKSAANKLNQVEYENKVVARLSGDEFVLFLYGDESADNLEIVVQRLQNEFKQLFMLNPYGEKHPIRISGGYALYPDDSLDFNEMLKLADETMYKVKHAEKGSFAKYEK